jgi:acetolactate synthase-1/2/3 large subunit
VLKMKLSGAQILINSLINENVDVIFGIPGGYLLPVLDKLYDCKEIEFILTRHEQGAAHAADGYARATGKVGVCMVTSGPGATNIVTGLATANFDSVPIVAITGQVNTNMIGNDAFQEADLTGITRSITKHNYLVKDIKDLARIVKEAFHIASTGRPGPVLIDLPKDIQLHEMDFKYPKKVNMRSYKPTYNGHPGQIKRAATMISKSKRPVLYAGGGVIISGAEKELKELAEKNNIPVTTTLTGLGGFPETHPLSLKMLGMHGSAYANYAIMDCDLIIAVGSRFDDRVTGKIDEFAPNAKVIHIDIDPASISKNVKVDIPIVGDCKSVLSGLNKKMNKKPDTNAWLKQIDIWKKNHPLAYKNDNKLRPQYIIEELNKLTEGKAIISTEVGQHQMWAAQFYQHNKPRTFLTSGGLGTMGYGFPAAMGAQVGCPDALVFDIAGDGSIQMNIQELATVANYNIPVKILILNNGYLGMVRQWQELFYDRRYQATPLKNPDFVKLAESYGVKGIKVTKKSEVRQALEETIKTPGPVVVDFRIESEENVFPMVAPGSAINKMMGGLA